VRGALVVALVSLLACAKKTTSEGSQSPAGAAKVADVQRSPRLTGKLVEALVPYSLSFAIPDGIELKLSKPEVGGGYEWVSEGEPGAVIVRWHAARSTDELLTAGDPAGAMAGVLIQSFGGTEENLVDRTVLRTPKDVVGTSWRVSAPKLTGWIAIYTNPPHRIEPDASEQAVDIFVIVVLGAPGSRTAFEGDAVATIRDSVRFTPL
jgi:hypothetical protein